MTLRLLTLLCLASSLPAQTTQGPLELTSRLNRPLYALPDDGTIAKARQALAADPNNPALALKLSLAEAGRRQYTEAVSTDTAAIASNSTDAPLYLERGHRELGLRQFSRAQADLERAVNLAPGSLDSHYHLGLALYFQGNFNAAAAHLSRARDLAAKAPNPNDSLIDCSAWLYNSYARAGMQPEAAEVLARITPDIKNTEPHLFFYLQLLHFYQGKITAKAILPPPPASGDTEAALSFNTISYGIGNWDLLHNQPAEAHTLFTNVVKGEAWNAWGFVASEVELSR